MKKYSSGVAILSLAIFFAVQLFAPQGTIAETEMKDKIMNYSDLRGPTRLSQLTGATLRSFDNEELGRVEDLVFKDGNIQYVIVSVGGVMGIGNRFIPVPWEAVKTRQAQDADVQDADKQDRNVQYGGNEFYVDMQKDRFLRSPSFASDNWPPFTNPNLDATVHQYFQVSGQ